MFSSKEQFKETFLDKLNGMFGKSLEEASSMDRYMALGAAVRNHIARKWVKTNERYLYKGERQVYYFSIEFLLGRLLGANLLNIGIRRFCQDALGELGIDLNELENLEADAGLGNGGLGRLAACFLDSMASLSLPVHGCGIRYKYGLFEQKIVDGYQMELPDNWLKNGNVWEIRKPDKAVIVRFYGTVRMEARDGRLRFIHENYKPVLAVPYDVPVIGFQNQTVNTLRLWSAETVSAEQGLEYSDLNRCKRLENIQYQYDVDAISEILYPDDTHYEGRVLRLKQQYFFVSAGLQSIVRRYKRKNGTLLEFADKIAIHINDTHPALVIPELMRIFIDEEGMGWEEAWQITVNTVSYTNHTILPEAMEKWPVEIMHHLLPRIYMILQEINERFCRHLWHSFPGDWDKIHQMAVIADDYVHMAHLAIAGSYSVNGVAKIHTEILKKEVLKSFAQTYPYKFNNKTNGITHRRWLLQANPNLARLISRIVGDSWLYHPAYLASLRRYSEDAAFREKVAAIKLANKEKLARHVRNKYGITLDPHSLFDVHVKRIHAYKRQLLNALHILDLYNRLKENPDLDIPPRTFIFAGKAAPGYYLAKRVIKLVNTLAAMVNHDPRIRDKLKVVFLENYSVSLAELIIPAADLSQQISTASKEASGTGNMKFMLNGAITLGTLDGANIEIREEVGDENIIIFGLTADEVLQYYQQGGYRAWDLYHSQPRLQLVLDQLVNGFLPAPGEEFRVIFNSLLHDNDEFFVLKDFFPYAAAQETAGRLFADRQRWGRMAIHNIAHAGFFSSDRTVSEYAVGIWKINPVVIGDPYMVGMDRR
ncbi:glycogen/starch/alpha-glucan phosphorylase [Acetonema longum]|uniref:Alpha-1,4 glucan phosphorylase n=1 Tax=Acetonema longum DSM 6540 TaxID=1009370 RepID=F7NQE8_9FIRM|nr:glycogen/starch/alpha-glucan phosphorylase [Acetonema longum]EGO61726.1 glycogen phosphorylase [Acetonema longum DSM 6540]